MPRRKRNEISMSSFLSTMDGEAEIVTRAKDE